MVDPHPSQLADPPPHRGGGPASGQPNSRLSGPRDYLQLLKPRVMSLSIFTAFAGMIAAPGEVTNWPLALISLLAIALGAGASGALNMWWDADIDAVMQRTKDRPIPRGAVPRDEALIFGGLLSLLAVWLLALSGTYLAAALLAGTILFYVLVYSMILKRRTPQNIVIGGAAGALPPVVGWAAITGDAPLAAWVLFSIIFVWTPPHFWALALVKQDDYRAAAIPMMPNVRGDAHTRRLILWYSVLLAPLGVLPVAFEMAGWLYGSVAVLGGVVFVALAVNIQRDERAKPAWRLFGFSIFYLFALFLALIIEGGGATNV
ncbi:putative heme o synthase transmembrane protein [Parvularcula bermudensis HTCC2503]|uniref:Protoheme IX farnesyltransferase n=1 Tax=Parvularcula bermudensis (strain ATCC BAA-594 / HTCC2503 / KCTC 12087) TaxID=314260 RepID=E0TD50_PARBH|nr:putative heme o synthase transmembrane protein [Parvularcula bermudensis HTCC2503]